MQESQAPVAPKASGSAAASKVIAQGKDKYATAKELGIMVGFPPPRDKRVTKDNAIQNPPYNRWAYQHMRMFFPSAGVPAADVLVQLGKAIDGNFENGVSIKEPGTDKTKRMADFLRETWADAIVVIRGDQIVYENYLNGIPRIRRTR